MSPLKNLYRETILQHAAAPVGYRESIDETHSCEGHNPLCGDRVVVRFEVEGGVIRAAAFEGEACTICLASASMMCEQAPGHPEKALLDLAQRLEQYLSEGQDADIGELTPLLGVRPYPSRVQCALLPWHTARKALASKTS